MSVPGPRTFGARFRRLRHGYRLTLAEVVPDGVISPSSLARIERGRQWPGDELRERLWSLLEQAIERVSNERVDLDELAELRDHAPWAGDEVARACVRMHPGGLDCPQIAVLMRVCLRVVEEDLANALAKLRAAARGAEGEAVVNLFRQWSEAVNAIQEERDRRGVLHEPDADSWDPESETRGQAGYSRRREAYPGFSNGIAVKSYRTKANHKNQSTNGLVETGDA